MSLLFVAATLTLLAGAIVLLVVAPLAVSTALGVILIGLSVWLGIASLREDSTP